MVEFRRPIGTANGSLLFCNINARAALRVFIPIFRSDDGHNKHTRVTSP